MDFTLSYDDQILDDVLGNESAIADLRKFAKGIQNGERRKPILISGPPGTGKSMSAHLLAKEMGWNVIEMNASDYRDKESIDKMLLAASQSRSLFGKKNMILLDEIDEIAGKFDKGANSAITGILKVTKSPIIFVANDRWDQSISFLRLAVDNIEFKKLSPLTVSMILKKFIKKFDVKVSDSMIDIVANRSAGDARSAINDILVLDNAPQEAVDVVGLRDKKIDIFATLDKIFFANTYSAPLAAAANADVENDMLMKWIDENISKRYQDKEDLHAAYNTLSSASMFASRASRVQYYTYWRYMNVLMSSGVALAKKNYPDRAARYTFPKAIQELSKSKESRGKGSGIAEKLKRRVHLNTARIKKQEMRIIASMAREAQKMEDDEKKEEAYHFFLAKFNLEPKEVDWLAENVR